MGEREDLIERINLVRQIKQNRANKAQQQQTTQNVESKIQERGPAPINVGPVDFARMHGILPSSGRVDDNMKKLQNIGSLFRREEAAVAAPIVELQRPGSLIDKGKRAVSAYGQALTGERTPELGDIGRQAGLPEGVSAAAGLVASMGLPTNLLTLGTGAPAIKATGAKVVKPITKIPSAGRSVIGDVSSSTIKDLRNIVKRRGGSKVFEHNIDKPQYVGDVLAPKVQQAYKSNADNLNKSVMKEMKIPSDLVSEVKKANIKSDIPVGDKIAQVIQTKLDEASKMFEDAFQKAPDNATVSINALKSKVGSVLREIGVIGEGGVVLPSIGKDPRIVNSIKEIYESLRKRTRLNLPKRIQKLEGTPEIRITPSSRKTPTGDIVRKTGTEGPVGTYSTGKVDPSARKSLKEASLFTNKLPIEQFKRMRFNLRQLLSGNPEADRLIMGILDVLDESAGTSGISGLRQARQAFKNAKMFQKKFSKYVDKANKAYEDFTNTTKIQNKLLTAQNLTKTNEKKDLLGLIGHAGDEIIDLLEANKIMAGSGTRTIGEKSGGGILGLIRKGAKKYIRKGEEKRALKVPAPKG